MEPGRDAVDAVREPWVARHGLLAAVVLAAVGLLAPLLDPAGDATATAAQDAAPYGVVGCTHADGSSPVDVVVTARALSATGAPADALGADGGPEVGASVRNLAGYAAEDVAPCEVVQVALHLHDGTGSVAGALRASRPLTIEGEGEGGSGRLVAVDQATWASSLPGDLPAGDPAEPAAWFVTLVDPAPGTYRWEGLLTAQTPAADSGPVEVVVEITPAGTA